MRTYFFHLLIALDQLVNALCAGYPDETLSARCYREKRRFRHVIDALFFWQKDSGGNRNHCQQCHQYEHERNDLPEEYKKTECVK
jgi:hypothetical protein